ncbi:3-methyl-2-oxobutanoate hydroxymethyltransferase [bacterium CG17_big_fil_post_rev_8_21_14_2_50_64_8]|nr:MAG: 3-methyl-2-oxobutanoate hydroxymethyltransferase [bacterium CG17_big_fil_post_rev_8_21_14_2_50_64_8]PJA76212.1 MAG: 3-methyl-2-oxobutanoate hydroxymethyltransferase [bacterium CG_4_9_14_3_um_filter_65_15]
MSRTGKPLTLDVFGHRKGAGEKIVVLTAYDLSSATIAADGGVDAILVGDSLGNVVLGYENTLPVTIGDMERHCAAVVRARPQVPVIADLPYGSFHVSPQETVRGAIGLVKRAGVNAVKLEGGRVRAEVIAALLAAEIPVMGHLGLTPQSVNRMGGFKVQGKGSEAAAQLEEEAQFLAQAGCFALVLECVPQELAARISSRLSIPTIGIGAGPGCDGQVLVYHDLLGLYEGFRPRFVKRYAELGAAAREAVGRYAEEVRSGQFPGPEHVFGDPAEKSGPSSGSDRKSPGPDGAYLGRVDEAEE